MKPLNGPIQPGGEPEPTEAEFRADWAALQRQNEAAIRTEFDESDPARSLRDAEQMERFVNRHRRRLTRDGVPTERILRKAADVRAQYAVALNEADEAEQRSLHAHAKLADAERLGTLAIFQAMAHLKARWPEMNPKQRAEAAPLLESFAQHRATWLAELPLEDRARLEREFPDDELLG